MFTRKMFHALIGETLFEGNKQYVLIGICHFGREELIMF